MIEATSKMAENIESDRCLIGKSAKSKAKYGTITQSSYTNETYLKHVLNKSDTLQGIALKYGVAMEQIKRANNIWTNDSLFIKDYVLIPLPLSPRPERAPSLPNGSSSFPTSLDPSSTPLNPASSPVEAFPHGHVVSKHNIRMPKSRSQDCISASTSSASSSSSSSSSTRPKIANSPPAKDFLSKFDSSLEKIRSNIQKLEQTTEFPEDASNPLHLLPQRRNSSKYGYRSHRSHLSDFETLDAASSSDPSCEPQLMFKSNNTTRSKHIQSSLEKLEKQQEDMFQL